MVETKAGDKLSIAFEKEGLFVKLLSVRFKIKNMNQSIQWSEHPGRFEKHLKRRSGNPLFSPERQRVSVDEIIEAKQKDHQEQRTFDGWFNEFITTIDSKLDTSQLIQLVQDLQHYIKNAAAIGGEASTKIRKLAEIEAQLLNKLDEIFPQMKEESKRIRALASQERIPFLAEAGMSDSPILKDEEPASLLCEDLETIATIGLASHTFPNYHPSHEEIMRLLKRGTDLKYFTKEKAKEIEVAWNSLGKVDVKAQ